MPVADETAHLALGVVPGTDDLGPVVQPRDDGLCGARVVDDGDFAVGSAHETVRAPLCVDVGTSHDALVVDIDRQGRGRARDVDGGDPPAVAAEEAVSGEAIGVEIAADDVATAAAAVDEGARVVPVAGATHLAQRLRGIAGAQQVEDRHVRQRFAGLCGPRR
jgi:hypothetical protein